MMNLVKIGTVKSTLYLKSSTNLYSYFPHLLSNLGETQWCWALWVL